MTKKNKLFTGDSLNKSLTINKNEEKLPAIDPTKFNISPTGQVVSKSTPQKLATNKDEKSK